MNEMEQAEVELLLACRWKPRSEPGQGEKPSRSIGILDDLQLALDAHSPVAPQLSGSYLGRGVRQWVSVSGYLSVLCMAGPLYSGGVSSDYSCSAAVGAS